MSSLKTIAHPYAKAIFDLACEQNQLLHWQNMLTALKSLLNNQKIKLCFTVLSNEQKAKTIFDLTKDLLDQKGKNLVYLLIKNQRLEAIDEIYACFKKLKLNFEQVKKLKLVSATNLTDTEIQTLAQAMQKRLKMLVEFEIIIDPKLIAGIIISCDDIMIDASISGQIKRLTRVLSL